MEEGQSPENVVGKKESLIKKAAETPKRILRRIQLDRHMRDKIKSVTPPQEAQQVLESMARMVNQPPLEQKTSLPISVETNVNAGEIFIDALRDSRRYRQDPEKPEFMTDDRGFNVLKPVERGYFNASSVTQAAERRYHLPLAFYIDRNHAMLIVKSEPKDATGRRKLKIYDPFSKGTKDVTLDASAYSMGVFGNGLAGEQIASGKYNINFLDDPTDRRLINYRQELMSAKFADFQKDAFNCIPYSLFVNAMLHGLDPNNTAFKREGRQRFAEDFGVKVLTREEIVPPPKPRVRLLE